MSQAITKAPASARKPILVTGSHRSGSTWTGKMIALSPQVVYIQEPFNSEYHRPGICGARFTYRFTYVTLENERRYYRHFRRTARLAYNWAGALKRVRSRVDIVASWREYSDFQRHRSQGHRPLFKDPLAILSAEWLAARFGMDVVVLIRHPAAFVSSLRKFGWRPPLAELLDQPLLMRDFLEPYRDEIEAYAQDKQSLVEQAAVFWKMLYSIVAIYQERHPNWYYVRHEALSLNPVAEFGRIFDHLSLPYTDPIRIGIDEYTNSTNPKSAPQKSTVVKLDSKANIWNWKERLTAKEVSLIRRLVSDVANRYYGDQDW